MPLFSIGPVAYCEILVGVSANLDLVRSIFTAWERGDFSKVEWADPELSFVMADGPLPGEWRSVGAAVTIWSNFLATMNDYRAEIEALRDMEDGRVLVLVRGHGRGRTSGVAVEDRGANIFEIRDAEVVKLSIYNDPTLAFVDLGLEE